MQWVNCVESETSFLEFNAESFCSSIDGKFLRFNFYVEEQFTFRTFSPGLFLDIKLSRYFLLKRNLKQLFEFVERPQANAVIVQCG